jgi:CheY-like chemotaxis protein
MGEKVILVVDDEPAILGLLKTALTVLGYQVLLARGPKDAIEVFRRAPVIDLLLSDVNMPEMDGDTLAARLVDLCPRLRVLLMTGDRRPCELDSKFPVLSKPISLKVLSEMMEVLLDGASVAAPAC